MESRSPSKQGAEGSIEVTKRGCQQRREALGDGSGPSARKKALFQVVPNHVGDCMTVRRQHTCI